MFSTTSTSYNKPQCKWHWNGSLLMVTWPELLLGSYKLYLLVAYLSSTCSGFQPGWCKTWSFRERQSEVTPVASTNTKYGLTNTNGSDILDIGVLFWILVTITALLAHIYLYQSVFLFGVGLFVSIQLEWSKPLCHCIRFREQSKRSKWFLHSDTKQVHKHNTAVNTHSASYWYELLVLQ